MARSWSSEAAQKVEAAITKGLSVTTRDLRPKKNGNTGRPKDVAVAETNAAISHSKLRSGQKLVMKELSRRITDHLRGASADAFVAFFKTLKVAADVDLTRARAGLEGV